MSKIYLVGGAVRDHFLGLKSKDLDYVVIGLNNYAELKSFVENLGCKIVVETPEYGVIRAVHPIKGGVDFALPRIDLDQDGRHSEVQFAKTIEEDLARRDFTMNAIALKVDGNLNILNLPPIDPFFGVRDIENKLIKFVKNAEERLKEDELRALRLLRFSITKNMSIDNEAVSAVKLIKISDKVSSERIFAELNKMFEVSNTLTIKELVRLNMEYILNRVKLKAST